MHLCIDIDGVIADTSFELDYVADKCGHERYDFSESFDPEKVHDIDWVSESLKSEVFWRNIRPYEDAWYYVNKWFMSGIDVSFITARNAMWEEITEAWLDDWDIPYNSIFFTNTGKKVETMINIQEKSNNGSLVFMIEDNPIEVNKINKEGMYAYCVDRPHNEGFSIDTPWWANSGVGKSYSLSELDNILKERCANE
jgi:uncharacterized HAD superfamily protein